MGAPGSCERRALTFHRCVVGRRFVLCCAAALLLQRRRSKKAYLPINCRIMLDFTDGMPVHETRPVPCLRGWKVQYRSWRYRPTVTCNIGRCCTVVMHTVT